MSNTVAKSSPPDHALRIAALDPTRSILVRAPAGSGKTTLLAERFLRLLAEVDEPGQVVAITFTIPAAAEMRNRVLDELRKDDPSPNARRALDHSQKLGWNLLDLPSQLRISTIDSFCRELALQQPLLSGLGGGLEVAEQPQELYRRAARRTLEQIGRRDNALSAAIESLLLWRDNNWTEIEDLLAEMLRNRDRWMHEFVLGRDPDWTALRGRLELPFVPANADASTAARYTDDEWQIVRACFTLLRHAAGQLQVVFAETGTVDFTEVAQIALRVLKGEDGQPTEATLSVADGIRHLLVDEFQDTSRRQHQLLAHLMRAWPEREGRTCFVVGDLMQSIYGFRDADAELFPRVARLGLEIPGELPFPFDVIQLQANFRSAPSLVDRFNQIFSRIFAVDEGSAITFVEAIPARDGSAQPGPRLVPDEAPRSTLHLEFIPETMRSNAKDFDANRQAEIKDERQAAQQKQVDEIVALARGYLPRIAQARASGKEFRVAVLGRTRKALAPVASALRKAAIPVRAVDLEPLDQRPEIIDALALARALLNPHDRISWLGVLRAPWCGLSLADLHTLTSNDDKSLLARAVPDLLAERIHLLSDEGRSAAQRVLAALAFSQRLRFAQPEISPGTRLEQVWLHLGGAQCVDAAARVNLDLLWRKIDALPQGELDLLGPALAAAIAELKAEPDPAADSDCGVQLMTIHKSKGLEFEVVIVPELHAGENKRQFGLLSWFERGLAEPNDSGEVTEFLVAPLQPKGSERGSAKKSVDDIRRHREKQELRRLLYVAATRAREELHLFARLCYKTGLDGALNLTPPSNSLLATAWPALEAEAHERFAAWIAARKEEVVDIAAQQEEPTTEVQPPALLWRLPPNFSIAAPEPAANSSEQPLVGAGRLYERHEGGLSSRALGTAVHVLFQHLAQLLISQTWDAAIHALSEFEPRIAGDVRAIGIDAPSAHRIAANALQIVLKASADRIAHWILVPHPGAANEVRWTGLVDGSLRNVRLDRVFRAGPSPNPAIQTSGATTSDRTTWWIIDYKTAHEEGLNPAASLPELRRIFAPQVETYAKVLRNLGNAGAPICAGLYYPRMQLFDWWQL